MVGKRLHGMDECCEGQAAFSGSLPAPFTGGPGILRLAIAGGASGPGRARGGVRNLRFLSLPLLVEWPAIARTACERDFEKRRTRFSFLPLLGQRKLDASMGRPAPRGTFGAAVHCG